jgi:hypothetical protein
MNLKLKEFDSGVYDIIFFFYQVVHVLGPNALQISQFRTECQVSHSYDIIQ